jgi:hypothetical protein
MRKGSHLLSVGLLLAGSSLARADFAPITVTPDSYNYDIVVEKSAIHAPAPATTASMDNGTANTGNGWYELGYNIDAPDTGLPAAGSTVTSAAAPDHSYTFASSYTTNNALLVDTNITSGTLGLTSAQALSGLSFLGAAGHGPVTVGVTIHHADGSTEKPSITVVDWFNSNPAVPVSGRLDVGTLAFANAGSGNPNLYAFDLSLSNTTSAVTAIDFSGASATNNSHVAIFAVSGATQPGGEFTPLAVEGFNQDMVVEATAPQALTTLNATTASMDAGTANTGFSWYERGYNTNAAPTNATSTGLPPAGTTLTNVTAQDHRYVLPASYTGNNALIVDASGSGTITFQTPEPFSALSFLTSSGNGAVTIAYTVNHADGSTDTGTFTSPDWFNGLNPAFTPNGRVDVGNGGLADVGSGNPRLYAIDITTGNTTSPITSIDLSLQSGGGHAAILAVSGATGNVGPAVIGQPGSLRLFEGSPAQFDVNVSGTLPLTYTWQVQSNGTFVNLANGGTISGADTASLAISAANLANDATYQLVVKNSSGSATSAPVNLTVYSATPVVTSPGDTIEAVGGTSPAAEPVEMAIDQTTQKYLNYGTDGDQAAPFAGPAGFIVTPTQGSDVAGTVVTAIRFYTANDAPERDPADYKLEGSNDGTNFALIAAGPLALPDGRNTAGAGLDPTGQNAQEVRFSNSTPYKSYRVLFTNVKNNAAANSMQIGEVELLGTVETSAAAQLSVARNSDGTLTISSPVAGTLQSTTALAGNGPGTGWTDEGTIDGSVTVPASANAKFYRLLVQQ